jgi:CspA family cold shock protein
MLLGKVKWFDNNKGFGFIIPLDDNEKNQGDVFVHHERIKKNGFKTLRENQLVKYTKEDTVNGILALEVFPQESSPLEAMENIIIEMCYENIIGSNPSENTKYLIYAIVQIIIYQKINDNDIKLNRETLQLLLTWDSLLDILDDKSYPVKIKKGLDVYMRYINDNEDEHMDVLSSMKI